MKKISKYQQGIIDYLRENETYLHYMHFGCDKYYFANKTAKIFRLDSVDILIKVGYLEKYDQSGWGEHKVRLIQKV